MLWVFQKEEREIKENRRLHNECKREILKVARMLLQSQAGNLGNLAQVREQNAHVIHNRPNLFGLDAHTFGALQHTYQATAHFFSMIFGGHKSNDVVKQPNV